MDEAPKQFPSSPPGSSGSRRLIAGYAIAGLLVVAAVVAVILIVSGGEEDGESGDIRAASIDLRTGVTDGKEPDTREGTAPAGRAGTDLAALAEQAGCTLTEDIKDEGNTHIPPGQPAPEYITSPPASGDHYPDPQADGAYSEPISPLRYIHALEHGRIAIGYSADLDDEAQLALKGVFDQDPGAMLLFPYEEMDATVAAVAWTRLLACDEWAGAATVEALQSFRDRWRGRGPERLAY